MHPRFSLPGIRSLAYLPASRVSDQVVMQALAKVPVSVFAPATPIEFTGECTCVVEATNENKGQAETATLTFISQLELPREEPLAFMVTDVMGNSYLLGAKEEPHPVITSTKNFGTPDGEVSAFTYEVIHKSLKALIPCLVP